MRDQLDYLGSGVDLLSRCRLCDSPLPMDRPSPIDLRGFLICDECSDEMLAARLERFRG